MTQLALWSDEAPVAPSSVIGCVWGAHRALCAQLETAKEPAPSYEWCEREWGRLRRTAPGGQALPEWLRQELWVAWRREPAPGRPDPCGTFTPAPGGAHPWCDTCGWRRDLHGAAA